MSNLQDLNKNVYPDVELVSERAILSSTNEQVHKINNTILFRFNIPTKVYYYVDTILDRDEVVHYLIEFLNSLTPPHRLTVIVIVSGHILLWILCSLKLCKGTRLQIKSLKNCLMLELYHPFPYTGCGAGETVMIMVSYDTNQSTIPV